MPCRGGGRSPMRRRGKASLPLHPWTRALPWMTVPAGCARRWRRVALRLSCPFLLERDDTDISVIRAACRRWARLVALVAGLHAEYGEDRARWRRSATAPRRRRGAGIFRRRIFCRRRARPRRDARRCRRTTAAAASWLRCQWRRRRRRRAAGSRRRPRARADAFSPDFLRRGTAAERARGGGRLRRDAHQRPTARARWRRRWWRTGGRGARARARWSWRRLWRAASAARRGRARRGSAISSCNSGRPMAVADAREARWRR